MINKIDSSVTFGRKEDVKCVHQARETLNNIYQKYLRQGMGSYDTTGAILPLNCVGKPLHQFKGELADELGPAMTSNRDLASDEKIAKMSLEQVQKLLINADLTLKNALKEISAEFSSKSKKSTSQIQKQLLLQVEKYIKTPLLITIPKK